MRVAGRDVGRVADDQVDLLIGRERGEPVAFDEAQVAGAEGRSVLAGERERIGRYVKRRHLRAWARGLEFKRQRDGDASGAGADVEDMTGEVGGQAFEREIDKKLGLGARNQRSGRAAEIATIELAVANQVGDGLTGQATFDELVEAMCVGVIECVGVMRDEPCVRMCRARVAERVGEQKPRFQARQAVIAQCVMNREQVGSPVHWLFDEMRIRAGLKA